MIKKINDNNDDNFKFIYLSACTRIRKTIKKYNLNIIFSYDEMIGCNRNEFKNYIYNNLLEGMTLDNFGKWEMDHIIPISEFKVENLNEIKTCFNYTNIKPMWKIDNRQKSNKI